MSTKALWHCRVILKATGEFPLEGEPPWPRGLTRKPSLVVHEAPDKGELVCELYFDGKPGAADLRFAEKALAAHFGDAIQRLRPVPLPGRDWLAESQKSLRPVRAGRFVVFPRAARPPIPGGAIPLEIEAGLAFGTGHHETTRGCLLALAALGGTRRPKRCLDLGCGSGILAAAMAKLWPRANVFASDNDPAAIAAAKRTFRANALSGVRAVLAEGFAHPDLQEARFDVIAANILAGPLADLAPEFAAHLAPRGVVIVSGILKSQATETSAAFTAAGLTLLGRHCLGDWPTLTFTR